MANTQKLTPDQQALADAFYARTDTLPDLLKFEMKADGSYDLKNESGAAIAVWMQLLSLDYAEEFEVIIHTVANLAPNTQTVAVTLNRGLASIAGMKPRDSIETTLCAQMYAINAATMRVASQAPPTFDTTAIQSNALTKLSRTYTAQIEALTRYRARGQQNIKVEHIHVSAGGQLAVGNFGPQGGRGANEIEDQPHVRAEAAQLPERPAMLSNVETLGLTLPGASGDGLDCVPVSWREGRGTQG